MDHDFTELKLLFLLSMSNILSNHRNILVITVAVATTIRVTVLVIVVQRADSGCLADTTVPHCAGLVVFVAEVEWLEEQKHRHTGQCKQQQDNLHKGLTGV